MSWRSRRTLRRGVVPSSVPGHSNPFALGTPTDSSCEIVSWTVGRRWRMLGTGCISDRWRCTWADVRCHRVTSGHQSETRVNPLLPRQFFLSFFAFFRRPFTVAMAHCQRICSDRCCFYFLFSYSLRRFFSLFSFVFYSRIVRAIAAKVVCWKWFRVIGNSVTVYTCGSSWFNRILVV